MDNPKVTFEFVDSTGVSPASAEPGGHAAPPSAPNFDNATGKATDTNQNSGGSTVPGSGATSPASPSLPKGPSSPGGASPTSIAPDAPNSPTNTPVNVGKTIVDAATKIAPGTSSAFASAAMGIGNAALSALGIGAAVAAPFAVGAGVARAIQGAANTAIDQTKDLNGEVAMAVAREEVRQLRANMRTGDRLGDELADNIGVRGRISDSLQTIRDAVTEPLLGALNDVMEGLAIPLELIANNSEAIKIGVDGALTVLIGADSQLREFRRQMKKDEELSFLDWVEKQEWVVPAGFNMQGQMNVVDVQFNAIPGLNL